MLADLGSKIYIPIQILSKEKLSFQHPIVTKVIQGIFDKITTVELDNLAAEIAASMTTKHAHFALLAARIAMSNLHKETNKLFSGMYKPCFYEFYEEKVLSVVDEEL